MFGGFWGAFRGGFQGLWGLRLPDLRCLIEEGRSCLSQFRFGFLSMTQDFAREECMRGVTLADVHCFDAGNDLCRALTATLYSFATSTLLHCSLRADFEDTEPTPKLRQLLDLLAAARGSEDDSSVLLLLRDAEDEHGPSEQRRVNSCVEAVRRGLAGASQSPPSVLVWLVPMLASLGPTELTNEVKSLRKSRAIEGGTETPSLEEALSMAAQSRKKFPPLPVLQQRCAQFVEAIQAPAGQGQDMLQRCCSNFREP